MDFNLTMFFEGEEEMVGVMFVMIFAHNDNFNCYDIDVYIYILIILLEVRGAPRPSF